MVDLLLCSSRVHLLVELNLKVPQPDFSGLPARLPVGRLSQRLAGIRASAIVHCLQSSRS